MWTLPSYWGWMLCNGTLGTVMLVTAWVSLVRAHRSCTVGVLAKPGEPEPAVDRIGKDLAKLAIILPAVFGGISPQLMRDYQSASDVLAREFVVVLVVSLASAPSPA
jgi:hypothetical protein